VPCPWGLCEHTHNTTTTTTTHPNSIPRNRNYNLSNRSASHDDLQRVLSGQHNGHPDQMHQDRERFDLLLLLPLTPFCGDADRLDRLVVDLDRDREDRLLDRDLRDRDCEREEDLDLDLDLEGLLPRRPLLGGGE